MTSTEMALEFSYFVMSTSRAGIIRTTILNLGSIVLSKCRLDPSLGSEPSYQAVQLVD